METSVFQEVYDKAYIISYPMKKKIVMIPRKIYYLSRLLQAPITYVYQTLEGKVTIEVQFDRNIPRTSPKDDELLRIKILEAFHEAFGIHQNTAITETILYPSIKPMNKDLVQVISG